MRELCEALGHPEGAFRGLHVVGTNGKTSVTLICAALLERGGLRTGACVSPHLHRWAERTRVGGEVIWPEAFADAVGEVASAVERLEADWEEGERVTQFEAAIAASFVAFRNAGVGVAVVEAGLGGRLDATNVLSSSAAALTSVALDHTDWLGETTAEIAAEKLAVLEPGTALVIGRLQPEIEALAESRARELGCELRRARTLDPALVPPGMAPYLARDAAVAVELAARVAERPADAEVAAVLADPPTRGRAELIAGRPPLLADAAHNEEGARALAEALESGVPRPRIGCVSILADKDAAAFALALAPALDLVVCTAAEPGPAMGRPGAGPLEPRALARDFEQAGIAAEVVPDPAAALARALELADSARGLAICAGSNYLLRYAWTVRRDPSCSR